MTNKRFWLEILVITLVFGMTVVGCDNGSKDDNDDDDYDNRPNLSGWFVDLDNDYPVVGETITVSLVKGISSSPIADPIGTPSWTWFKTQEDTLYLSKITNKTMISSSNTYTVKQEDLGFWIWVEVSYSGNRGTKDERTDSTVIGIPATANVSVSMTANYFSGIQWHSVTVKLILSEGRWNDIVGRWEGSNYISPYDIASQWITMSGTPSVSSWYTGYETPSVYAEGRELRFSFSYQKTDSDTILPLSISNLTATLNTAQLSTMCSNTNVSNTLSAGTPATVSVSQWTISQH